MKLDEETISAKKILIGTGALLAYLIGVSFSTGQECLQYFTAYGVAGFGALAIALVLMCLCISQVMLDAKRFNLTSAKSLFSHYCGEKLAMVLVAFIPLLLYAIFIVMLAGSGATFEEYYGLHPAVGRLIMVAAAVITVLLGLEKLVNIIGRIGPVIIIFIIIIGLYACMTSDSSVSEMSELIKGMDVPRSAKNWFISSLIYSSSCLQFGIVFYAELGLEMNNAKDARIVGILGNAVYLGTAAIISYALLVNIKLIAGADVPMLMLATQLSPMVSTIFSITLILGIYTTAAPILWTVVKMLSEEGSAKYKTLCIVLAGAAFSLCFFPYQKLVNWIFPINGYVALFVMAGILWSIVKKALPVNKKDISEKN